MSIEFDITEGLTKQAITRITKVSNIIEICYNELIVKFNVDERSWKKTIQNLENSFNNIDISKELLSYLKSYFSTKYEDIIGKDFCTSDDKETIYTTFKYSCNGQSRLNEAIILDDKPVFIAYNNENESIEVIKEIVEPARILKPPSQDQYPYKPYEFENISELNKYVSMARDLKSVEKLYKYGKEIYKKYIIQDYHVLRQMEEQN